jgi:hypothetical protein
MSDADRQRARKMMEEALGGRDMASLSAEERQEIFQKMRQAFGGGGGAGRAGQPGPRGTQTPGGAASPSQQLWGGSPSMPPTGAPMTVPFPSMPVPAAGGREFGPEERQRAELPAPPQAGSDVDFLLRPGLLADAEVIVQQIPDTLYIPFQAVFDSGGTPVVYVQSGGRFEVRKVELGQRSESQVAVVNGVKEGELVALEPPEGRRDKVQKKSDSPRTTQPAFPGAVGAGVSAAPGANRAR